MKFFVTTVIALGAIAILYFIKRQRELKKEIELAKEINQAKQKTIETLHQNNEYKPAPANQLYTHDQVISMSKNGKDPKSIADELHIPQNKVEMTLRFDKMKNSDAP
jgi:DNA-binding NarL/FixJ family response regulator